MTDGRTAEASGHDPHATPPAEVLAGLKASGDGLSTAEAKRRSAEYGPNALPAPSTRSLAAVIVSQLRSPLIYLLIAAAGVSVLLGEADDAIFVGLALALNTAIGAHQEHRAEVRTAALRSSVRTMTRALRDGVVARIDVTDLVPGDVVVLEGGDRVPADLRLLRGADVRTDESSLTGESAPVEKSSEAVVPAEASIGDRTTMLHAGTTLMKGHAVAVVTATGTKTELGRIAGALAHAPIPPPLTLRLERFGRRLGYAAVAVVTALIAVRMLQGAEPRETFFLAVALAVSIIPEGLPVAVTVALAAATRRMARRNVIVRHLPAVEGLGSCTVVATDKTGTLTVDSLTAVRLALPGLGAFDVTGEGIMTEGEVLRDGSPPTDDARSAVGRLVAAGALCNDASFDPARGAEAASGDTIDVALLVLAAKAGLDRKALAARERLDHMPFEAERRFAAVLTADGTAARVDAKGAVEVIAPLCTNIDEAAVIAEAEAMAARGLRVLALAGKRIDRPHEEIALADELYGLELLGLAGFMDPLRPEAREAVAACRRAGVAVKMVTGDHPVTALAIARELGLAARREEVVTGAELAAGLSPERVASATVFARVEPLQKVAIVEALQDAGHIVAMTGDGVNDAPALQRADIGIAMGRGGTDAAREAADLVLTDDDFASIVAGIEEGRAAYANIRKVIYLLLSTGAAEVVLFVLSIAHGLPVPLLPVHLLWLNLVTNGGQDVALALEKREPDLLSRPPRAPDEPLLDRAMIRQVTVSGLYTGIVAYGVFAWLIATGTEEAEARNVLLFLMVSFENVQVFNCRSETRSAFRAPLSANPTLIAAVFFAQGVHLGAAHVPGLREVLQVAPVSSDFRIGLFLIAASLLAVMEIEKGLRRRAERAAERAASFRADGDV